MDTVDGQNINLTVAFAYSGNLAFLIDFGNLRVGAVVAQSCPMRFVGQFSYVQKDSF